MSLRVNWLLHNHRVGCTPSLMYNYLSFLVETEWNLFLRRTWWDHLRNNGITFPTCFVSLVYIFHLIVLIIWLRKYDFIWSFLVICLLYFLWSISKSQTVALSSKRCVNAHWLRGVIVIAFIAHSPPLYHIPLFIATPYVPHPRVW